MVSNPPNTFSYNEYLESDCWKCDSSLISSHHWVGDATTLTCKFCGKTKGVPRPEESKKVYPRSWQE